MNKNANNPKDLLSFDPAAVAIKATSNQKERFATLKQLKEFATSLLHYVDVASDEIVVDVDLAGESDDDDVGSNDQTEKVDATADKAELPSNSERTRGKRGHHQPSTGEAVETSSKRYRTRLQTSGNHLETKSTVLGPLLPRKLPKNYDGTLQASKVRRSDDGLTRADLNDSLGYIGLKARFGVSVILTYGSSGVSHLTLQPKWNDAPQNDNETLEWWLGEGTARLALAQRLDPSHYQQADCGIPVFWAILESSVCRGGGAILYYIGHYKCIRFVRNLDVTMKGTQQQALIELKFISSCPSPEKG